MRITRTRLALAAVALIVTGVAAASSSDPAPPPPPPAAAAPAPTVNPDRFAAAEAELAGSGDATITGHTLEGTTLTLTTTLYPDQGGRATARTTAMAWATYVNLDANGNALEPRARVVVVGRNGAPLASSS